MKVLTFLPRCDLQRRVEKGLSSAQFVVETVVSAKECLEFAQFAQYEAVLVDSDSLIFADVLALVRLLRQENSGASLFVFARYLDLEQRLLLFEAGADDCVREPFFDTAASGGFRCCGIEWSEYVALWRSGTGSGAANGRAAGQGHRPAAEGISVAAIPGTKRQSAGDAHHDPGACVELLVRGLDQRSRRVHQRSAQQGRS
jgi:CheY-like chemotaxis protein